MPPPLPLEVSGRRFRPAVMWLIGFGLLWLHLPVAAQQENRQPSRARSVTASGQPTGSPAPVSSLPADSQATPNRTRSEINLAAAHELLDLTGFPSLVKQTSIKVLRKEIRKRPEMREAGTILRELLEDRISTQIISEEMAKYLADRFDEQELRQLKAILDTSTGRKMFTSFETLPTDDRVREASYLDLFDEQEKKEFQTFYRLTVFRRFSDYTLALLRIGIQSFEEQFKLQGKEFVRELVLRPREQQPRP
ncbi:hypothetical protein J8C02_12530 [Chloracidobacterium sp. MS 40/45]|uniref:hypothetical protein n=1 Tax=Chloracidobacterium aggregatum TaxID=2851959 RepID=UPI001B8C4CAB|nr:hypothetical protein [Chloracidobacterium aggregatum]QUW01711.1 hypothetical protein J8C02_12530 [Chloracidobacterium sp. MS 40/45]